MSELQSCPCQRQSYLENECDNTHLELSNLCLEFESSEFLLKNAKQENEQLKKLLLLVLEDIPNSCTTCTKEKECILRTGSHKYCWKWQHADKLKGLIEI